MKARYCCCPIQTPKTYFKVPDRDIYASVEGDYPIRTLEETELLDYSVKKIGNKLWDVSFGRVTIEGVEADSESIAYHKSRWYMVQLIIHATPGDSKRSL